MITTNDTDRKKIPLYAGCVKLFCNAFEWYAWLSRENHERVSGGGEIRIDEMSVEDRLDRVMRHLVDWDKKDTDGAYHLIHAGWQLDAAVQTLIKQTGCTLAAFLEGGEQVKPETANPAGMSIKAIIDGGTRYPENWNGKKVYIAGPMRHQPNHNYDTFDAVRNQYLEKGWAVISPADMDRASGIKFTWDDDDIPEEIIHTFFERCSAAVRTLKASNGDMVVMLPGWDESDGAKMECAAANFLGVYVEYLEWVPVNIARMQPNEESSIGESTGEEQRQPTCDGAVVGHG